MKVVRLVSMVEFLLLVYIEKAIKKLEPVHPKGIHAVLFFFSS